MHTAVCSVFSIHKKTAKGYCPNVKLSAPPLRSLRLTGEFFAAVIHFSRRRRGRGDYAEKKPKLGHNPRKSYVRVRRNDQSKNKSSCCLLFRGCSLRTISFCAAVTFEDIKRSPVPPGAQRFSYGSNPFSLFLPLILAGHANGQMRLVDSGSGLSRTVTVESTGLFRLVFEAADNWGIAQWYDLVNDPSARTNLTGPGYGVNKDISTAEPGLFQQVFYGTNPDDPKLYTRAASYYFPKSPRTFNILENSPSRVVVQAISSPITNAVGVLSNVTADVTYYIYPNGKIYVHSILRVRNAQTASEWRCATLGLSDPTSADPYTSPDSTGWIRSSATQNPYHYAGRGGELYLRLLASEHHTRAIQELYQGQRSLSSQAQQSPIRATGQAQLARLEALVLWTFRSTWLRDRA